MVTTARSLAALGLGLAAALVAGAQPTVRKIPVVIEIVKLADTLEQGNVSARGKKIIDTFDACDMPMIFRLKERGGAGIGSAAQAGHKNSIDDLVRDWAGRKPPTQKELDAHRMDLVRTARVLQTLAEMAPHRVDIYIPKNDEKRKEQWFKVAADFKVVTGEFREALEQADVTRTRNIAVKLHKTCMACHQVVGV
jgi:hypothetical protein